MPLIRGFKQEEEDKKKKLGAQPLQQPGLGAAPAQAAPTPQTQAASQALGGQTSVQGGNFINLKDYLNANEGQGKAMADKVVGGIEGQASQIAGADVTTPVGIGPTLGSPQSSKLGGAEAAPKSLPQMLSGQAEMDAAKNVERGVDLLGTQGGQTEILDRAYGSGRTAGESDFDNALMGAGAGGRFQELQKKYAGLSGMVQGRNDYNQWSKDEQGRLEEDKKRIQAGIETGAALDAEAKGKDQHNVGIGQKPNSARNTYGDYGTFAGGTNNDLQTGHDWFKRNVSEDLWNKLSDEDLKGLASAIASNNGKRNGAIDQMIADLKNRYGA